MSDREAVLFANQAFYAAFGAKDAAAMDAVWSRDRTVSCIHPGRAALRGRDEVMASWRAILQSSGAPDIREHAAEADIAGDVAIVTCLELLGGRQVLAATNVFVRAGSRWSMVHHQAGPANVDPRTLSDDAAAPPRRAMN